MSTEMSKYAAQQSLLSLIEDQELRGLRWGYVDGSLTDDDVVKLVEGNKEFRNLDLDPESLIEDLIDLRLLFEFEIKGEIRYRTRFAEGMRLLAKLKQLFPNTRWPARPDLVFDFRVDAHPRKTPRRDHHHDEVMKVLRDLPVWKNTWETLFSTVTGGRQLSGFQLRATQTILNLSETTEFAKTDQGTVLTSGTGSGKTLAFYLPTILQLSEHLKVDKYWVKLLAVFPRQELLKDQCSQAYAMFFRLRNTSENFLVRPFRLGTFFGDTPYEATEKSVAEKWDQSGDGYICPYFLCPMCESPLVWDNFHLDKEQEILKCRRPDCSFVSLEGELSLTRNSARTLLPDVMFTTPESLNRQLGNSYNRPLMGINKDASLRAQILLLDEIHTYEGTTGAQYALLFRRWRHAVSRPIHYVGLSATLTNPDEFFGELVNLPPDKISVIAPQEDEFQVHSMEYHTLLRGHPTSNTALLSTTIQTAFLLGRLMDDPNKNLSNGTFGNKVFAFTDDLDVENRLFDALKETEGFDKLNRIDPSQSTLASLRSKDVTDSLKAISGQDWSPLEDIGRPLAQKLRIGRVSSQDRGVEQGNDILVATATLEVGFNDPTVGGIIQHKAPRNLASYIQRKGRAGRSAAMRPWTVTILSDYGRDRAAYQSYEELFDPILESQRLPINNNYVRRIQATFSLLDWIATRIESNSWTLVTSKGDKGRQTTLSNLLVGIMSNATGARDSLKTHIQHALDISPEETDDLLWESPRSLLFEVLPSLNKHLTTGWDWLTTSTIRNSHNYAPPPLPQFLPSSLFAELNLPEVTITLPPAGTTSEVRYEQEDIAAAIEHAAPGRVTRRYGFERGGLNHWFPVRFPLQSGPYDLKISEFCQDYEQLTNVLSNIDGQLVEIPHFRPLDITLSRVSDDTVSNTSNARPNWETLISMPDRQSFRVPQAKDPLFADLLKSFDFHMHLHHSPVSIQRFTHTVDADIRTPSPFSQQFQVTTRYVDEDSRPAAIGFQIDADALLITLSLPSTEELTRRSRMSPYLADWRNAYLFEVMSRNRVLTDLCNYFQLRRLFEHVLTALIEVGISKNLSLVDTCRHIIVDGLEAKLIDIAKRTFQIQADPDHLQGHPDILSRMNQNWQVLITDSSLIDSLKEILASIEFEDDPEWAMWLKERTHETMGVACMDAITTFVPNRITSDALALDLWSNAKRRKEVDASEIWITETSPGGAGVIESISTTMSGDGFAFTKALNGTLATSETEITLDAVRKFLKMVCTDPKIAKSAENVRTETRLGKRLTALEGLYATLENSDLPVQEEFKRMLNHRIFREGAGTHTDSMLLDLLERWGTWENTLGIGIDLNTFAFVTMSDPEFGQEVRSILADQIADDLDIAQATGVLIGLLWPSQAELRTQRMQVYSRFHRSGYVDPAFVTQLLMDEPAIPIKYGSTDWEKQFNETLEIYGTCRVKIPDSRISDAKNHLFEIIGTPATLPWLSLYPVLTGVSIDEQDQGVILTFILRELSEGTF